MKIAIITINKYGEKLAKKLKTGFPGAEIFNGKNFLEVIMRIYSIKFNKPLIEVIF